MLQTTLLALLVSAGGVPARAANGAMPPPVDAVTRTRVVEALITRLDQGHVFPEVAQQVGASVRARLAEGAYDGIADPEAFARRLDDDVRAVAHDGHLRVFYSREVLRPSEGGGKPSAEEIARARERMQRENFGFEKVEVLPGNIGYLDVRYFAWVDVVASRIAGAMAFVADTLLTSQRTFSGAEDLAYDLQALKRATIVGQTTGGGANGGGDERLDDHFDEWITDPANSRTVQDGPNESSLRVVEEPALTHAAAPPAAPGGSR